MEQNKLITIEIVYGRVETQQLITLQVAPSCTIFQAIQQSGILTIFPEINLSKQKVGVFSKIRSLDDIVQAGDRIEIYRPLLIDPKESRRLKAKKVKKKT